MTPIELFGRFEKKSKNDSTYFLNRYEIQPKQKMA